MLLACASAASAAGLGKLSVLTDLGQPLRAEIDVVAVEKGELDSLQARLGSVEAYLQNNLPYPPPSLGLTLTLEKRASGQPYISATTKQPVNEPFVDVLVELTWNGGRILRAYTALLDPPAYAEEQIAPAAPQAAAPEVRPAPEAAPEPQVETQLGSEILQKQPMPAPAAPGGEAGAQAGAEAGAEAAPGSAPAAGAEPLPGTEPATGDSVATAPIPVEPGIDQAAEKPLEAPAQQAAAVQPPAEAGMPRTPEPPEPAAEEEYTVKRGDNLTKIARKYMSDDVSLEQMLVVLYRNNKEAFSASNMNRLKAGKVLEIPSVDEAAAIDLKEARREVRLQTADFHAYRERIAAAAGIGEPTTEQAGQSAAGGVTGTVQDKTMPALGQPKEVLKLSKGDAASAAAAQERIRSLEEEVAAREKTIKEQADRVARLEKTVKDMQTLLDIKSKGMADLQQQAGKPTTAPAAPPAAPATPGPVTAATAAPAAPAPGATSTPPAPPAPPAPATVAAATTPPDAAIPAPSATPMAQSAPAAATTAQPGAAATPKPRVRVAPPPPPAASSLIDDLLGNPLYLAGGAAAIGLLGFLGIRTVRRRRESAYDDGLVAEKKNSEITPPPVRSEPTVVAAGAATAATRAAAQAAQVSEEVDPLAEAEIYLAYGRDGQAEEILREALQGNPRRHEIHLKLLEIYAKRKDAAAFDGVARELQAATGGHGDIWLQAVRLGYPLDPQNPRYAAGKPAGGEAAAMMAAVPAVTAPSLEERLDFNIGLEDSDTGTKTDIDLTRLGGAAGGTTTDIDLSSLGAPTATHVDLSTMSGVPERTLQMPDVDLDLGAPADEKSGGLNFDFDLSGLSAAPAAPQPQGPSPETTQILDRSLMQTVADVGEPGMGTVEFDLSKISLDTGGLGKTEPTLDVTGSVPAIPEIDLSGISLDLGTESTTTGGATATGSGKDDHWYDVQTKFDLAKAYQEMGDKEGAREILQEVMAEGDSEQKAAAQRVLETLA